MQLTSNIFSEPLFDEHDTHQSTDIKTLSYNIFNIPIFGTNQLSISKQHQLTDGSTDEDLAGKLQLTEGSNIDDLKKKSIADNKTLWESDNNNHNYTNEQHQLTDE